jgi:hypothetical protein
MSVRMDGHVRKPDTSPAGDRGLSAAGAEDLRDTIRANRRATGESRTNLREGSLESRINLGEASLSTWERPR